MSTSDIDLGDRVSFRLPTWMAERVVAHANPGESGSEAYRKVLEAGLIALEIEPDVAVGEALIRTETTQAQCPRCDNDDPLLLRAFEKTEEEYLRERHGSEIPEAAWGVPPQVLHQIHCLECDYEGPVHRFWEAYESAQGRRPEPAIQ